MPEFWKSSGLHLLERRADGWLLPTPDFLRAYFARPEMLPVETSCPHEITLHEALMESPALAVDRATLALLADPDAADNYRVVLAFRDLLLGAGTLEEAYLRLARSTGIALPPVFIDQLVHVILANALAGTADPLRLRAAELFFREQSVSIDGGRLMLADDEIVEMRAVADRETGIGQLLAATGTPQRAVTLDVLGRDNAAIYWQRSDRFDTVVDFRFGQPVNDAFARVVEVWMRHLMGLEVVVTPAPQITDERWRWHIGLDQEANRILNQLYEGNEPGLEVRNRIIALYRMRIVNQARMLDRVRGSQVYLGLAMTTAKKLVVKPQNLIANLPLRGLS